VYWGREDVGIGDDAGSVSGADDGADVAVGDGVRVGLGVTDGVRVGKGVKLGGKVRVGNGVKLSTTGWKGVGVALAFGLTVTRLRDGEDSVGSRVENVQDAKNTRMAKSPRIRDVQ
jgi:hypothetical protein